LGQNSSQRDCQCNPRNRKIENVDKDTYEYWRGCKGFVTCFDTIICSNSRATITVALIGELGIVIGDTNKKSAIEAVLISKMSLNSFMSF
jgi:hypothetical protein